MRRLLGIPLSQYTWAFMILALLLAARVKHGMDLQDAVTVGIGTWVIATAALVSGRWIRPVLPDWMRPAKASAITTDTFPWRLFLVGNTMNLAGLLVFWANGITLLTFFLPILGGRHLPCRVANCETACLGFCVINPDAGNEQHGSTINMVE